VDVKFSAIIVNQMGLTPIVNLNPAKNPTCKIQPRFAGLIYQTAETNLEIWRPSRRLWTDQKIWIIINE